ncbi:MAG TPA: hypothetical protein PK443_04315 [bacterium]|nr:hypothetical protein [bacterium]
MFIVFIFIASILSSNAKEPVTCGILMDNGQGADVKVVGISIENKEGCPLQITIKGVASGINNKQYKIVKGKSEVQVNLDQSTSRGPCFYKLDDKTVTCDRYVFER